jgi:tetratricopeptide (TPR) repeat protein
MKKLFAFIFIFAMCVSLTYSFGELSKNYWKHGQKAEKEGNLDKAVKYYTKVVKGAPEFVNAYYCLGNIAYKRGDIDGAIEWYKKSLEHNKTTYAYLQLGTYYLEKGKKGTTAEEQSKSSDTAQIYFEKALTIENTDVESEKSIKNNQATAYYNLYIIFSEKGMWDKAEEAALNAMVNPAYEEAMSKQLINIYTKTERYDKALQAIDEKLKENPDNLNFIKLKINILNTKGDKKGVLKEMAKLENLGEGDMQVLLWLGQDAINNKDYEKALGLFNKAIAKEDDNAIAYLGSGKSFFRLGKKNEAMEQFKKAEEHGGSDPVVIINIGDAYMELENYGSAINYYSRLIVLKKADYSVYHNLGKCYFSKKPPNCQKAIGYYKKALVAKPNFLASMIGLTYAYYMNKQHKKAYYWGKKVLKRKKMDAIKNIVTNIEKSGVLKK